MYILELKAAITETKITKDHDITLLQGHFPAPLLFKFPKYLGFLIDLCLINISKVLHNCC